MTKTKQAKAEKVEVTVPKTKTVHVELTAPVLEHGSVMLRHLECKLTPRQSKALRLLFDGLTAEGETILLGSPTPEKITNQHDAVRWMLDKIADAVE